MREFSLASTGTPTQMMDNRKFLIIGFLLCVAAAIAYTFVFADLPFVTAPTSPDGAPLEMPAPAPQQPAP